MTVCANGNFFFDKPDEVTAFVREHAGAREQDEIWIFGEEKYPCIALLTHGEYAAVNYFEQEDGGMWLSEGRLDKEIAFLAGGEEWIAPSDAVISLCDALQCVTEFCETGARPSCIHWQEL